MKLRRSKRVYKDPDPDLRYAKERAQRLMQEQLELEELMRRVVKNNDG